MDIKQAANAAELRYVEVKTRLPGQTEPAYFKPLTLLAADEINRKAEHAAASDGEKLAITLICCLCDKEGNKIFDFADKRLLMTKLPQGVLVDIVNEITAVPTIEQAEGN